MTQKTAQAIQGYGRRVQLRTFRLIHEAGLSTAIRVVTYCPRVRQPVRRIAAMTSLAMMLTLGAQANLSTPNTVESMTFGEFIENYPVEPDQINPLQEVPALEKALEIQEEQTYPTFLLSGMGQSLKLGSLTPADDSTPALASIPSITAFQGPNFDNALLKEYTPAEKRGATLYHLVPSPDAYVTSRFGWRHGRPHNGIDFAAHTGTAIYSSKPGRVVFSGWEGGYGRSILIDHGKGVVTRYAHCSVLHVVEGEQVEGGQLIGRIGSTGHSTGPHLHFEVLVNGVPRNPEIFLNAKHLPEFYNLRTGQVVHLTPGPSQGMAGGEGESTTQYEDGMKVTFNVGQTTLGHVTDGDDTPMDSGFEASPALQRWQQRSQEASKKINNPKAEKQAMNSLMDSWDADLEMDRPVALPAAPLRKSAPAQQKRPAAKPAPSAVQKAAPASPQPVAAYREKVDMGAVKAVAPPPLKSKPAAPKASVSTDPMEPVVLDAVELDLGE